VTSNKTQVYVLPGELLLLPVPENPWPRHAKAACQGGSEFVRECGGKRFILSTFCSLETPGLQLSSLLPLLQGVAKGETRAWMDGWGLSHTGMFSSASEILQLNGYLKMTIPKAQRVFHSGRSGQESFSPYDICFVTDSRCCELGENNLLFCLCKTLNQECLEVMKCSFAQFVFYLALSPNSDINANRLGRD